MDGSSIHRMTSSHPMNGKESFAIFIEIKNLENNDRKPH